MWPRWVSTVLRVTNRTCAISGLLRPSAASSATRRSETVSCRAPAPAAVHPARPPPRRAHLRAAPLGKRAGAAALGEIQPVLERVARLGAAVATPQRGTQVGERAGILEPCRRALQHRRGLAQPADRPPVALDQRGGAQRHADPAGRSPAPPPLEGVTSPPARPRAASPGGEREAGA